MTDAKEKFSFRKVENFISVGVLIVLSVIPFLEVIIRKVFKTGIPGSSDYVFHAVLWITFVGGMITSREKRHLALTAGLDLLKDPFESWIKTFNAFIAATFSTAFMWSALSFVIIGFDPGRRVGIFPIQLVGAVMPIGFGVIAVRFILGAPEKKALKAIASAGFILGTLFGLSSIVNILYAVLPEVPGFFDTLYDFSYSLTGALSIPFIILLIAAAITGTPIFIILGGFAYMLFSRAMEPLEIISNESYTMLISNTLPAIPLFTIAGFILSESKAGKRFVRLFKAFFGWLPGGLAIMAVLVCTFFTTFTGASGVTILALGALLLVVLVESGRYKEDFSIGLLTSSGSLGLMFPPSLPIIIYGVAAQISIKDMFIGGIIPGLLMMLALIAFAIITALKNKVSTEKFTVKEALGSAKEAVWEILLPVIILASYFGGLTTLVETGAIAVVYAFVVEVFINKDIKLKDLPGVLLKCVPIIGGVLVILALAKGLSYFIIDAEIPMRLTAWVQANIHSKYVFLILLNVALLITGALMDIFSAIMVVVPLIIPLGNLFGIHPVHLGIIFLANLQLGYLTPPVGLNLFLASYRFNRPLGKIARNIMPFFLVLLLTVLLITYVPWFSIGFLK
ncbi:MAG: TRAP transporter large permease subunit [Spirochaetales bacterium]|nr:MAG: TRAP transporter large permease subunit [Spirochaetales bacterium]